MRPTVTAAMFLSAFAASAAAATAATIQVTDDEYTVKNHSSDSSQRQVPGERPSRYCMTCDKPCGTNSVERRSDFAKIANGKDARENEFGWAATLSRWDRFYCGGSLITKKHVLTAAHCIANFRPKDITVTIGDHDRYVDNGRRSVHDVANTHWHPNFSTRTFENDIAVVELSKTVSIKNPWVRYACLPKFAQSSYEGIKGTVIGWGRMGERRKLSNVLQKIEVPIISNDECKNMGYPPEKITNNMICAGYKEGIQDSCQGDSGGPMHRQLESSDVMEVIGIVSWGKGCARENYPGMYTRVSNYLDWIMDHTGDECICGAESS